MKFCSPGSWLPGPCTTAPCALALLQGAAGFTVTAMSFGIHRPRQELIAYWTPYCQCVCTAERPQQPSACSQRLLQALPRKSEPKCSHPLYRWARGGQRGRVTIWVGMVVAAGSHRPRVLRCGRKERGPQRGSLGMRGRNWPRPARCHGDAALRGTDPCQFVSQANDGDGDEACGLRFSTLPLRPWLRGHRKGHGGQGGGAQDGPGAAGRPEQPSGRGAGRGC